jgi:L-seryl-tRNA(Ser) seleniumtransferase
MTGKRRLTELPSIDAIIKSEDGSRWLENHPRAYVLRAVREVIQKEREDILAGKPAGQMPGGLISGIEERLETICTYSLKNVINATGVVLHTNLGRSVLSKEIAEHAAAIAGAYSNLEYELEEGVRGKRYSHIKEILREVTGAEDGIVVNNNAAAVLVCLSALAKGKEVIISRGELVEIGGSFRIPDVMESSGAILKEVGTTNKTHIFDYERALTDKSALMLKVHQSNFRMLGFTSEVSIAELAELGRKLGLPVMFDLGSGCLVDLKPYGIHIEPTVREVVKAGADIVTFSGDKLLGGPQAGVIVGRREHIEKIEKSPLLRAMRIDKMTLAAFEATLKLYADEDAAKEKIPTLAMLLQEPGKIQARAKKIAKLLIGAISADSARISVTEDVSQAGGGALAEVQFATFIVSITPARISVNELEARLRVGKPPVVSRIRDGRLVLDARTILASDIGRLIQTVASSLSA